MLSIRQWFPRLCAVAALAGCGSVVVVAPPGDVPPTTDGASMSDVIVTTDVPRTCASTSDCRPGEECAIREGCGTPSYCGPALGRPCTTDAAAYCGCDGVTFYASSSCPTRTYAFRGECPVTPPPPPPGCVFPDGRTCAVGQRCRAPDGCNTCTCGRDGSLSCTEIACPDGGPPPPPDGCVLSDGGVCPVGARCRAPDGCNTCTCRSPGDLVCTTLGCVDAGRPDVVTPPDVTPVVACRTQSDCPSGSVCDGPAGCGVRWSCVRGLACTRDVVAYCGCDGTSFGASSTCPGRPYQHRGRCSMAPDPDAGTSPSCPAQDARGEGACARFFGYAWNGATCVGISGCSCVGAACSNLSMSPDQCVRRFGTCP